VEANWNDSATRVRNIPGSARPCAPCFHCLVRHSGDLDEVDAC
jgi:hypothetical protein